MRLSSYSWPSRAVCHPHGVQLDGDAALALEVHRVEQLVAHLALLHRAGGLDEPVGQRGFAVIDVGDDAEVADAGLRHGSKIAGRAAEAASGRGQRGPAR